MNSYGVDLNQLFGMTEQFRTFECRSIGAGEPWVPFLVSITDDASDNAYPVGYEPLPRADGRLHRQARVGQGRARSRHEGGAGPGVRPHDIVRTDINAEQVHPGEWGFPHPMASILPVMPPVSVGDHTVEPIIVLSAPHCDVPGTDPELQCLPAGELSDGQRPLTITTPER